MGVSKTLFEYNYMTRRFPNETQVPATLNDRRTDADEREMMMDGGGGCYYTRKEIKSGFSFGMVFPRVVNLACVHCVAIDDKGKKSRQLILFPPDVKLTNSCNDLLHGSFMPVAQFSQL